MLKLIEARTFTQLIALLIAAGIKSPAAIERHPVRENGIWRAEVLHG